MAAIQGKKSFPLVFNISADSCCEGDSFFLPTTQHLGDRSDEFEMSRPLLPSGLPSINYSERDVHTPIQRSAPFVQANTSARRNPPICLRMSRPVSETLTPTHGETINQHPTALRNLFIPPHTSTVNNPHLFSANHHRNPSENADDHMTLVRGTTVATTYPPSSSGSWTGDEVFYPAYSARNTANKTKRSSKTLEGTLTSLVTRPRRRESSEEEQAIKTSIIKEWLRALPPNLDEDPNKDDNDDVPPLSPLVETDRGTMRR
ncbi:hypothetical protein BT63DRAFT_450157 [Microthyrium microscopicum]|uniref:Uncharacterized protein n=1 Tax=Microthyrium microscopicum TaxID=703497 RepID=A0A6A6USB1_9PEZI|nr:hypothetical protein BT63DRAFT_450157 [Microthyrium microscopicum]